MSLFFSKQAEEGFELLKNDLRHLSQRTKGTQGYLSLLKIAGVCGVAGASIFLGAFLMQCFLGLF